jgi:hypothetical protein
VSDISTRIRRNRSIAGITALAVVLGACGAIQRADTTTTTTTSTTTTTTLPPVVWPLTGLPAPDEAALQRPAIVAKIDGHQAARPQVGLDTADIVFEARAEGEIARFGAVFHSRGSDPVGPIRSARTHDIEIFDAYNTPIIVWSGGRPEITKAFNEGDFVNAGHTASKGKGGYYRDKDRKGPHNLFASTQKVWDNLAPADAGPPPAQFGYAAPGEVVDTDRAVSGVKIVVATNNEARSFWKWDEAAGVFQRYLSGGKTNIKPHNTVNGQITTHNILVLEVKYKASWALKKSPHAITIGSGTGWLVTSGGIIDITWSRADAKALFDLRDSAGRPVRLTAGRTWVSLVRAGSVAEVPAGTDQAAVPFKVPPK